MMLLIEQNYNNNYIVTMLPILIPLKKVFKDLRSIRCIKLPIWTLFMCRRMNRHAMK